MVNYFPHDYDAQTDPKLQALIAEYKSEGYGVYWCVIEMLHKEQSHHLPRKKYVYSALAKQMSTSVEQIEAVLNYAINECELFIETELGFTSKRVLKNIKYMQDISEKRSKAGKKSAESRKNSTSVEQVLTGVELCSTNKIKETKIKEIKEIKEIKDIVAKATKPKHSIEEQMKELEFELALYRGEFPEQMLKEFYDYWTEPNQSKTKIKQKLQKTWDTKRRLNTWASNDKNFIKNGKPKEKSIWDGL